MYTLIDTPENLFNIIDEKIRPYQGVIGADIESTGLDWFVDDILLVQLSLDSEIFIFDVRKLGYGILKALLESLQEKKTIFHNAQFDLKFLFHRTGIWLDNVHCTMVAEAILNAGISGIGLSLKALAKKYLGMDMEKESREEFLSLTKDKPLTNSMLTYAATDVAILNKIRDCQVDFAVLTRSASVLELDMRVVPVIARMEYNGIKLDKDKWVKKESETREELGKAIIEFKRYVIDFAFDKFKDSDMNGLALAEMFKIPVRTKRTSKFLEEIKDIRLIDCWIFDNFNPNSSNQIGAVFTLFGIKVPNTNEKTISYLANDYEVVSKLLKIRELAKQVSTYGLSWLEHINSYSGRVHTSYFSGGTDTGRFSSNSPNMQNVPSKGGFRECFVPENEYVFIACDYSQQEYRLAGAVSGERAIIDSYIKGYDMHTATAAQFFEKELSDVDKDERSWGKTRNFEIIYGTTEWGLHKSLKSTLDYAKEVLDKYWKGYPILYAFKTSVEKKILEVGYSVTPLGRRRYVPEKPLFMNSSELVRWRAKQCRELFNHIIQGGGADIIKIAMVNICERNPFGDKFKMLLQIHDELVFEVHESIKYEALKFIQKEMVDAEQPFLGEIPAVVEGSIKCHWSK